MPHFENDILSIDLLGEWLDQSDKDVSSFINSATNEELTIGIGQFKQQINAQQMSEIVWRLIQQKAGAMGQISGGNFTVLDAVQPHPSVPYTASFSGYDKKNLVYVTVSITAYPLHFFSASYYLHKSQGPSVEAASRASAIVSSCRYKFAA